MLKVDNLEQRCSLSSIVIFSILDQSINLYRSTALLCLYS